MCKKTNGNRKLTPRQTRFVAEYLVDLNATQAAIRAGYSPKTADTQACRALMNVKVAAAIAKAQASRGERTQVTADKVVAELAKIAFCNADDYFTWGEKGVRLKSSEGLTRNQKAAVGEVSETTTKEGGTIRIKLHDKLGALEKLGKHLGMFIERTEHSGFIGQFPDAVSRCDPDGKRAIADILRQFE